MQNYIVPKSCFFTQGYNRSLLVDLERTKILPIPSSLIDFLKELEYNSLDDILLKSTLHEDNLILKEYFEFAVSNEYLLEIPDEIDKLALFPEINLEFKTPNIISNIVLDLRFNHIFNVELILKILEVLKCYDLQIIISKDMDLTYFESQILKLSAFGIRSIELIVEFVADYDFKKLVDNIKNISFVFIYSSPKTEMLNEHYYGIQQIFSSVNSFEYSYSKKIEYFNTNMKLFSESQLHNTYFNQKLFISSKGEIKNAPETEGIFGFIQNIENPAEIKEIVQKTEFQKYWRVHKDLCDVCKDCEFKYLCVDNRLPFERKLNEWYHKIECNYNPYISKWEGEEGYKTLEECGVKSNGQEFIIDHDKIALINSEIWVVEE